MTKSKFEKKLVSKKLNDVLMLVMSIAMLLVFALFLWTHDISTAGLIAFFGSPG